MMTVYEFELPKGYTDEVGNLHRKGRCGLRQPEMRVRQQRSEGH